MLKDCVPTTTEVNMPKSVVDRQYQKNRLAVLRLADKCWRKPWKARLDLLASSQQIPAGDKKLITKLAKDVGSDSLEAAFDYIDQHGIKLSLFAMQWLRSALRESPPPFLPVSRSITPHDTFYLETRVLEGGAIEREIGLTDARAPLIAGVYSTDGKTLRASSIRLLGQRLLSPHGRDSQQTLRAKIAALHSKAAHLAAKLDEVTADEALEFRSLATLLARIQSLTLPRYEPIMEAKARVAPKFWSDGSLLRMVPAEKQACSTNGCTSWPDGNYKGCCDSHDICYCHGGTETDRIECDITLYECVKDATNSAYAFLMYMGVRKYGVSHFNYYSAPDVTTTTANSTKTATRVRAWLDSIWYFGSDIGNDTVMRFRVTVAPKVGAPVSAEHKENDLGNQGYRAIGICLVDTTYSDTDPLSYIQVWAKVKEKDAGPDDVSSSLVDYPRGGTTPIYPSHQWNTNVDVLVSEWCEGTAMFRFYYRVEITAV